MLHNILLVILEVNFVTIHKPVLVMSCSTLGINQPLPYIHHYSLQVCRGRLFVRHIYMVSEYVLA